MMITMITKPWLNPNKTLSKQEYYDDDDYHVLQLFGCEAFLEDGSLFGTISDVLNLPGQDVLAITTRNGEVMIPFVHQLVPTVDIADRKLVVIPPTISGSI